MYGMKRRPATGLIRPNTKPHATAVIVSTTISMELCTQKKTTEKKRKNHYKYRKIDKDSIILLSA